MRLDVWVAGDSPAALPRIVSLLHRRATPVSYLEFRQEDGGAAVTLEVEAGSRGPHLVAALERLVEVREVRRLSAVGRQDWVTTAR